MREVFLVGVAVWGRGVVGTTDFSYLGKKPASLVVLESFLVLKLPDQLDRL